LELTGGGEADWHLAIPADDTYTIYAWWPAAPSATNWTTQALYQIISGTTVLASTNYDQTSTGDQWHLLGTVQLFVTNVTTVRLTSAAGICLADALHIYSASRFNNGQPAATIHLQPMDGILLQRDVSIYAPPRFGVVSPFADHLSLLVSNLIPGVSYTLQKSTALAANSWQSVQVFQTMGFATNLSDALPPAQTPVFYRLRGN
jgi:hypothetical protein